MAMAGGRRALPVFDLTRILTRCYFPREEAEDKVTDILDALLEPLDNSEVWKEEGVNGKFWIRSAEEETFLEDEVIRKLESKEEDNDWGLVHDLVFNYGFPHFRCVLSLGVDPDQPSDKHGRPSHSCSSDGGGTSDIAEFIAACRPDLTAKDCVSRTPLEKAQRKRYDDIAKVWETSMKEGPPSIARLAFEKKWWAVQNLVRRKVVPEDEMFQIFEGKDAIGWAKHYGITGMAEELEYYFIKRKDAGSETAGDLSDDVTSFTAQLLVKMGKMVMQDQATRKTVESLKKDLARQTSLVEQLTKELEATKEKARLEAQHELEKKDLLRLIASLKAELAAEKENKKRKSPDSEEQSAGVSARPVEATPSEQAGAGGKRARTVVTGTSKPRRT